MIFSSAYATVLGVLSPLITDETAVISDALNHNCIINAIALSRPARKAGLSASRLRRAGRAPCRRCRRPAARAVVVTDGIFSMRGDHAPLGEIMQIAAKARSAVPRERGGGRRRLPRRRRLRRDRPRHRGGRRRRPGGRAGRHARQGVRRQRRLRRRGSAIVAYLRETSPIYIYSNPITPGEAEAARVAVDRVDSEEGRALLAHLRAMTQRFREGLRGSGFETIPGEHPVVPLLVRDTARTATLVAHLREQRHPRDGAGVSRRAQGRRGDPLPDFSRPHDRGYRRSARRTGAVSRRGDAGMKFKDATRYEFRRFGEDFGVIRDRFAALGPGDKQRASRETILSRASTSNPTSRSAAGVYW